MLLWRNNENYFLVFLKYLLYLFDFVVVVYLHYSVKMSNYLRASLQENFPSHGVQYFHINISAFFLFIFVKVNLFSLYPPQTMFVVIPPANYVCWRVYCFHVVRPSDRTKV